MDNAQRMVDFIKRAEGKNLIELIVMTNEETDSAKQKLGQANKNDSTAVGNYQFAVAISFFFLSGVKPNTISDSDFQLLKPVVNNRRQ